MRHGASACHRRLVACVAELGGEPVPAPGRGGRSRTGDWSRARSSQSVERAARSSTAVSASPNAGQRLDAVVERGRERRQVALVAAHEDRPRARPRTRRWTSSSARAQQCSDRQHDRVDHRVRAARGRARCPRRAAESRTLWVGPPAARARATKSAFAIEVGCPDAWASRSASGPRVLAGYRVFRQRQECHTAIAGEEERLHEPQDMRVGRRAWRRAR